MKRKGRLLDIGCGNGYFFAACRKRGYEVQGLDISDWAATYATQKLGLPITVGEIEEVELSSQSFDIITMWHFLEHTSDPAKTILKAKTWLKKDGVLVVDVPNYESTDACRNGRDWVGWQPPFHLYHFTPKTLGSLLKKCGFRVVRSKTYHSEVVKRRLKRIPGINLFARLISKLYSGHSVAVVSVMDKNL